MMLDLKTTKYYLDCYGTDTTSWPEPEAGKIALAVYTKELGDELTNAKRLDAALKAQTQSPPSDLLARRIMAGLPAQDEVAANDKGGYNKVNWRAIAAAFVVLGAVGFTALNTRSPAPADAVIEDNTQESEIWREAALNMGVDDVFDWVYAEDG